MASAFTQEDFKKFVEELEEGIIPTLSPEEIQNLTIAIARVKGEDLREEDIINALEQYKRDNMRCIMWRAVFNGMVNLNISDDGTEIAFVPDGIKNEK